MGIIVFDSAAFRAMFPAFSDPAKYPDLVLQMYWDMATAYVSNKTGGCYTQSLKPGQQTLALNLMTAHIAFLMTAAASGQGSGGVVTGATIDKVSVTIEPPPSSNNWQYWLNQSPYGQQLLALLHSAGVGGFYFGGFPTVNNLRR